MTAETLTSVRELDCRQTGRVQVRLLWNRAEGGLWVAVIDTRTGDSFSVQVRDGERPTDVFNHPYAFAAYHGIETTSRAPDPEYALR